MPTATIYLGGGKGYTVVEIPATGVTDVTGTDPVVSSGGDTPNISIDVPGQTEGDLFFYDGTRWNRIPAGPMNFVLVSQGPGLPPVYAPPSGGGVGMVTASSPIASSGGATPNISFEIAGQTEGDIVYFDGVNWVRLPAGAPGQILETQGTGAPPQWIAAPATGVTAVTGTAPITSTGGPTPAIGITAATELAAGSMSAADKAKLDALGPGPLVDLNTFPGVDPTGTNDSSAGIQLAINALQPGQRLWGHGSYVVGTAPIIPIPMTGTFAIWCADNASCGWSGAGSTALAAQTFAWTAAPGTVAFNLTWYNQTAIFFDPVHGDDRNDGMSHGSPVAHFREIVRRFGSAQPKITPGQQVVIFQLSGQVDSTDGVDLIAFGQSGGQLIIDATQGMLSNPLGTFASGALTGNYGYAAAAGPAAGGTQLQIAGVPGYVVAGTLLINATRLSECVVQAISGGAAFCSQPQTTASLISTSGTPSATADQDWVAGDTIIAYSPPLLYLKNFRVRGGDVTAGGQLTGAYVFHATIADPSGTAASSIPIINESPTTFASCVFKGKLSITAAAGRASTFGTYLLGCYTPSIVYVPMGPVVVLGGAHQGNWSIEGGLVTIGNNANMMAIVGPGFGSSVAVGSGTAGTGVYATNTWATGQSGMLQISSPLWGNPSCEVYPTGTVQAYSSFTTQWLTLSGTMKLGSATTGTAYNPTTGAWLSGITIKPANIDAPGAGYNPGLQNPSTGARYCQPD